MAGLCGEVSGIVTFDSCESGDSENWSSLRFESRLRNVDGCNEKSVRFCSNIFYAIYIIVAIHFCMNFSQLNFSQL